MIWDTMIPRARTKLKYRIQEQEKDSIHLYLSPPRLPGRCAGCETFWRMSQPVGGRVAARGAADSHSAAAEERERDLRREVRELRDELQKQVFAPLPGDCGDLSAEWQAARLAQSQRQVALLAEALATRQVPNGGSAASHALTFPRLTAAAAGSERGDRGGAAAALAARRRRHSLRGVGVGVGGAAPPPRRASCRGAAQARPTRHVAHHTSTTLHSLGHLDRPGAEVCVDAAGRAACGRRREGSRPRSGGGGGGARAERRRRRRWHESAGGAPGEATGADGGRGGAATGWERDAPAGVAVLNACVGRLQAQPDASDQQRWGTLFYISTLTFLLVCEVKYLSLTERGGLHSCQRGASCSSISRRSSRGKGVSRQSRSSTLAMPHLVRSLRQQRRASGSGLWSIVPLKR